MEHWASLDLIVCCCLLIIPEGKSTQERRQNGLEEKARGPEHLTVTTVKDRSQWRSSHLFSTVDESLLLWGDPFLLLYSLFNSLHLDVNKQDILTYPLSHEYLGFFVQSCKNTLFHYFTLSVGSMSISISFPVRVWNITLFMKWRAFTGEKKTFHN